MFYASTRRGRVNLQHTTELANGSCSSPVGMDRFLVPGDDFPGSKKQIHNILKEIHSAGEFCKYAVKQDFLNPGLEVADFGTLGLPILFIFYG